MAFARRATIENDALSLNQKGVKAIVPLRNKSSALGDVKNIAKFAVGNDKLSALERQRAAAERLSKGYSVVRCPPASDKENDTKLTKESKSTSFFRNFGKENTEPLKNVKGEGEAIKPIRKFGERRVQGPAAGTKSFSGSTLVTIQETAKPTESIIKEIEEPLSSLTIEDDVDEKCKDELLLGIYAKDIYRNLRRLELEQAVRSNYITKEHLMTEHMRAVLVDWMFEVQKSFELLQETAQIAVALLDRFLQDTPHVRKDDLQLVAVSCIFLAAKYEEMFPPGASDLVLISADAYHKSQILRMEKTIFRRLRFNIGRPTPVQFLKRYCRASCVPMLPYAFSKYFIDLALVQYQFSHVPPSLLAAAALCVSLFLVANTNADLKDVWTSKLAYFSGYQLKAVQPLIPKLANIISMAPKLKQQSVQRIYAASEKYFNVSLRSELTSDKLQTLLNMKNTNS